MNRFLSKKKASPIDDGDSAYSASRPKDKRWRKGSKTQEEQKPQIDLDTVLPSTDDFRTSLIMPNLSARFSMLREQDDPLSKIGKASDDSVLQPRRQSRLPDFGFSNSRVGLTDIAEVSSMTSSVRPPWMRNQHDSFVSDDSYGADADSVHGSVMSRSRPGEGNVLFGGRQKVYKIPSSTSTRTLQSGPSMGKLVYEDDVTLSSFQKFKLSEKAAKEAAAQKAADESEASDASSVPFGLASSSARRSYTAPLPQTTFTHKASYGTGDATEQQRQTSIDSSAASDNAHEASYTPATSVASHSSPSSAQFFSKQKAGNAGPLERSLTKRRLYEQSLDQNMQEQQVSQLTRLNSIQKQRNFSGAKSPTLGLFHARSAGNLQERSAQQGAVRPQSPTEQLTTFESLGKMNSVSPSPPSSHPQSPTFFPLNEYEEMNPLSGALHQSDRGKATAMGAFHMPKQPFDEDQYLARLQRLQNSQSPTQERSSDEVSAMNSPEMARLDSAPHGSREPPHLAISSAQPVEPTVEADKHNAFSVFQRAAAQMRTQPNDQPDYDQASPASSVPDTHRTFFGDISASDDDEEDILSDFDRRGYYGSRYRPGGLENIQEYPSGRGQTSGFSEIQEEEEEDDYTVPPQPLRTTASKPSLADSAKGHNDSVPHLPATAYSEKLPTSAYPEESPVEQQRALGGLIHQHLRNTSNVSSSAPSLGPRDAGASHYRNASDQSSIYPPTLGRDDSAPSMNDATSRFTRRTYNSENRIESSYTHSNPWDLDEMENTEIYGLSNTAKPAVAPTSNPEPRVLTSTQPKSQSTVNSPRTSETSWQPEHKRDLSEGTLLEREAFDNELAARQKAIQENLKSIVEVDSRGSSPQPTQNGAFKAFNMLKSKSSRDSMVKSEQAPSKAMKMLGIGAGGSSPNLSLSRKSSVVQDDGKQVAPGFSNSPRPSLTQRTPPVGSQKINGVFDMQRPRGDSESSTTGRNLPMRPSPPSTTMSQIRDRSNSSASIGKATSRQDRLQEPDRSAYDGPVPNGRPAGSPMASQTTTPKISPGFQGTFSPHFSPQHSPNAAQRPPASSEERNLQSGPRMPINGQSHPPHSSEDQQAYGGSTPVRTPTYPMPMSQAPTKAPMKPPPPPGVPSPRHAATSPYHANPTPPASGHSTPVAFGPATPTMPNIPNIKQGSSLLRRKTVSKNEISEPILISSTSNVDTVDLPPGASLKNGMEQPPPIPPVNPRRRATKKLFGFGKNSSADESPNSKFSRPTSPPPIPTSAPIGGRMISPEPYREHTFDQGYRSVSAPGHRPDVMRAMRSNESFERPFASPTVPPPQRPIMTDSNMF